MVDNLPENLPQSVGSGVVFARFRSLLADGTDSDTQPERQGMTGVATIRAVPDYIHVNLPLDEDLSTIRPVDAMIVNGVMQDVPLMATDTPYTVPFQYIATFNLDGMGNKQPPPVTFYLPTGSRKNLSLEMNNIKNPVIQPVVIDPGILVKTVNGTLPDVNGNIVVSGGTTIADTDALTEGASNQYFTAQRALDATKSAISQATTDTLAAANQAADQKIAAAIAAAPKSDPSLLPLLAKTPEQLITGTIVRDSAGRVQTADVLWPDGTTGTYTTLVVGPSGGVDSYKITYGTKTFTQPTITRDSNGNVTLIPQIQVN